MATYIFTAHIVHIADRSCIARLLLLYCCMAYNYCLLPQFHEVLLIAHVVDHTAVRLSGLLLLMLP